MKTKLVLIVVFALAANELCAAKFWEKPYSQWTKGEVFKLLNDSPWGKQMTTFWQTGDRGTGISGEKEIFNQYTVRPFTALPIRHAYVRLMQLMNNYDSQPEDRKREIDLLTQKPLAMDTSQQIIVAIEFASNQAQTKMDVDRQLRQLRTEELSQQAYLISQRLGRVRIKEYYPPAPDGTGFKLVLDRKSVV